MWPGIRVMIQTRAMARGLVPNMKIMAKENDVSKMTRAVKWKVQTILIHFILARINRLSGIL